MSLEAFCCVKCMEILASAHPVLAGAWGDMCSEYVLNGLKPIKWGTECEAMQALEHNGFVVTHEPEKPKRKLIIRPNGHRIINGRHYFCIVSEKHLVKD